MLASGTDTFSFACSACGKCCNSPPLVSVPELFHHQHRFIGSLVVRPIPALAAGDRLGTASGWTATEVDARAHAQLADALLHRLADGSPATHVLIATQALAIAATADASSSRCPALGDDMRCTIHHDRKPAACSAVPLDPLVPDRLQHVILADRRREASYFGAECIVPGTPRGVPRLTTRLAVVDPLAGDALARRRRDLLTDKRLWGDTVFGTLRGARFDDAIARIPRGGFLVMAIAPVLAVLAAASPRSRERCIAYLQAQIGLIEEHLDRATLGQPARSAQARSLLGANQALHRALTRAPAKPASPLAKDIDSWIGLAHAA